MENDRTSAPTRSPTASPTISHVPTISHIPTFEPSATPTRFPTIFPTNIPTSTPSQSPSLTPPVTSVFVVPYERISNSTTQNLTAVEAVLKEDDLALFQYLSNENALLDEPFEVESVLSQIINENQADVCTDSAYLCYEISTNVNVTRYPVTYSTNRSELIVMSSVLDFMEEREITIVPLEPVPDEVESILSITFAGVSTSEMNTTEMEAFESSTFDFLFDNLGQLSPPVLVETVTLLSQSLSLSSTGASRHLQQEQDGAELIVDVVVAGEYLPPPEIIFDDVLVEVFDDEGQEEYLEVLSTSDSDYFDTETNEELRISELQVFESISEDDSTSKGSVFGGLGDDAGYSIIAVGCAIILIIVGMLMREKVVRSKRSSQRYSDLKEKHIEERKRQNEFFAVQDKYYGVEDVTDAFRQSEVHLHN